jgi:peroxiredoxin
MRLQQTIADWEADNADHIPLNLREPIERAIQELTETGIDKRALRPGDLARDFRLASAHADEISLAAMLVQGPVVLSFQRGTWCPYAGLELDALNEILPEITRRGATLVGVVPEPPETTGRFVAQHAYDMQFLCDIGNRVAGRYRLTFRLPEPMVEAYLELGVALPDCEDAERCELSMPATYVITPGGRIHAAFVHADPRQRREPEEILYALDDLNAGQSTGTG